MHEHIVNLADGTRFEPGGVLTGAWRSFAVRRIAAGQHLELDADGVEHLAYVLAGSGTATVSGEPTAFGAGAAFSVVRGDAVRLVAAEPTELFVTTLRA